MKPVRTTPARALIATALLLLGLQLIIPVTLRASISAQVEAATANLEKGAAAEGNRKMPADLFALCGRQHEAERLAVIVQTAEPPTLTDHRLVRRHGGQGNRVFRSINAMQAMLPLADLEALAAVRLAQNIRPDADRAVASDDLLTAGRSLSELSDDLQLTLTDPFSAPLKYAVLDNGFLLTNGHLLSNGFLLTNEFRLTNGSVWPDGHMRSNSYAETCVQSLGEQLVALQSPIQNRIARSGESFYADGALALSGFTEGSLSFAPQATAIWSQAVVDPRSPGLSAGAESLALLASNDDTAIFGVRYITSSSPFFPRQR